MRVRLASPCSSSARPPGVCEFASRHLALAPHDLRVCASSPRSIPAPAPSSARPPGVCESASRHLAPAPHDLRVCVSVRLMSSLLQLLTTSGCVRVRLALYLLQLQLRFTSSLSQIFMTSGVHYSYWIRSDHLAQIISPEPCPRYCHSRAPRHPGHLFSICVCIVTLSWQLLFLPMRFLMRTSLSIAHSWHVHDGSSSVSHVSKDGSAVIKPVVSPMQVVTVFVDTLISLPISPAVLRDTGSRDPDRR